ncbi:MAG: dephospho-CoA kinase [Siphonobacter sp.]
MTNPKLVGITGGIGSGKSLVARIFATLGIPVYEADDQAKWLITNDKLLRREIVELLGKEAYLPDGSYHRAWVSRQVFGNEPLLNQLNAIVHPRVRQHGLDWAAQHQAAPYLLYEAAVMNAAGQGNAFQKIIVIEAPVELRVKRVLQRDHRPEQIIRDIIRRQASEAERQKIADYVIFNDDQHPVIDQVLMIDSLLRSYFQ